MANMRDRHDADVDRAADAPSITKVWTREKK